MDNTPFGRLPRGLRDRIYEYAVVHPHGLKMRQYSTTHGKTKMPCRVARTSSSKNATIALAKTCKQLHEETIGLYYKLNTFYFPFNSSSVECLTQFLHSLKPEYHNMVRHVVFRALDKHISWHEKRGDLLMNHWYEVMHQIVVNAKTLLPGPIFVGGHFQFDCDPVRLRPCSRHEPHTAFDITELARGLCAELSTWLWAGRDCNRPLVPPHGGSRWRVWPGLRTGRQVEP